MSAIQNIIDFAEQEMHSFADKPFGAVDSLVLSQFSYMFFDDLVPGVQDKQNAVRIRDIFLAEHFTSMLHNVRLPKENKRLLTALASSPRYRDVKMDCYVNEIDEKEEKQFSAVSFILDADTAYIAYRGTDATLIGWKEDFNMAFLSEVPAQAQAVSYMDTVSRRLPRNLIVGGHSKGGNLAVYASMMCKNTVQKRITAVYSHDGPGFNARTLESEKFHQISNRVHKTVPQSSIIGMLLEHQEDYTVVKSNRVGIMQHDPFSWEVTEEGFHLLNDINNRSQSTNRTIHDWLAALSDPDRERFVDTLYQVITANDAKTIFDFQNIKWANIKSFIAATSNIDAESRKFLSDTVKSLIVFSFSNIKPKE